MLMEIRLKKRATPHPPPSYIFKYLVKNKRGLRFRRPQEEGKERNKGRLFALEDTCKHPL